MDDAQDYVEPAGIIAQVDRNGNPVKLQPLFVQREESEKQSIVHELDSDPKPRWSLRRLLCGCFPPSITESEHLQPDTAAPSTAAPRTAAAPLLAAATANGGGRREEEWLSVTAAAADPKRAAAASAAATYEAPPSALVIPAGGEPEGGYLLPPKRRDCKVTLVLDLDETLVHSSFKPVTTADFIVPVEVDGIVHRVFVSKRPGVDHFMQRMGELFEVVVFTASLDKYANPVLDHLDTTQSVDFRLFREACVLWEGSLVKDLSRLGRDVTKVIIVDNAPTSYMLQPENSIPIISWFDDPTDDQLDVLVPWLQRLAVADDVLPVLSELRESLYQIRPRSAAAGGGLLAWAAGGESEPLYSYAGRVAVSNGTCL